MTRDDDIFDAALALPVAERVAYLERVCGDDAALRARVEALLRGHDEANSFLQQPLATRGSAAALPSEEKPGDAIGLPAVGSAKAGRYKLLEKIGEGGCGVVWVAEQGEPVRRRVALKVIKLGMDTREVVARFEAERQALALMDHPNIAKVHDGGATANGRPFFVMELVRGLPITRYCDEAKLTPAQRLELFIAVCQAVQHAHQKGVIHRDLKPSNLLVTVNDGVATPKVIDFGIAKATQGSLTEKTVYTAFQQFIGTPTYMSPEQADLSSVDIDTRADIYSLGVLLYELLTGAPPFDPKTLASSGLDEVRRIIREVEPPRPSTRVATLGDGERTTLSRQRSLAAHQLSLALRGDLDWIVMRCLEKDRARRYETANALAADLRRHLAHEPVVARPPSAAYLLQKLVRRHRLAFGAGALVLASLVAGLAFATVAYLREKQARQDARVAEQAARAAEQLGGDARQNAERLLAFIVSELGEELDELGQLPTLRNLNGHVLAYYEQLSPALHTRETRAGLAFARTGLSTAGWFNTNRSNDFRLGDPAARKLFEDALRVMEELEKTGPLTPLIRVAYAGVLWGMVGQCYNEGRPSLADPLLPKAEALLQPVLSDLKWGNWADSFTVRIILGRGFLTERRASISEYRRALARAEERDRRGLTARRAGLLAAEIRWRLGLALAANGQWREARAFNDEAQRQLRELLTREPFLVVASTCLANTNYELATLLGREWQIDEGRKAIEEATRQFEQVAKSDPAGWGKNGWMVNALVTPGKGKLHFDWLARDFHSAEAVLQTALRWLVQPQAPPRSRPQLLRARFDLSRLYAATRRDAEADQQLAEAQKVAKRFLEERPWLMPTEKLAQSIKNEVERCGVEAERLNWAAVRTGAQRILKAGTVGTDEDAETTEPTNSAKTAHRYLMRAAFETGDYATARRELEAWGPQVTLRPDTSAIESRFQRVLELLTRIHVLARAGELATARTELARIWDEAEAIFDTGREHLFVQIEHARALSIRAEVEDADPVTKRGWLERAAGLLRPAAAAGRLTRYEHEVTLHRIKQQLAGLADATTR